MLLNPDHFETEVLGSDKPVLVDFFGTWCPPCRQLLPTIHRLAEDGYSVCKVNIDDRRDLAVRYGVNAVPTLVIVKDGEEISRLVGFQPERTLRQALERAQAS